MNTFKIWNKRKRKMIHNNLVMTSKGRIGITNTKDIGGYTNLIHKEYLSVDKYLRKSDIITLLSVGKADKYGKNIYEGDILNFNGKIGIIYKCNNSSCFRTTFTKKTNTDYWYQYLDMITIEGNVFENIELIKEDKLWEILDIYQIKKTQ